ncbi:hypothetical protein GUJ93_ZPchr0005g14472 [Zizania palustris]|uniref:Uncharacterized protein n=1 Tax=Zizania palustris TaxID=103762 RepID=A0A8J5VH05_ZIZPA|nr:hypothetical protein GUJ93_ZPchr0005g14472 [Zizania palustris]
MQGKSHLSLWKSFRQSSQLGSWRKRGGIRYNCTGRTRSCAGREKGLCDNLIDFRFGTDAWFYLGGGMV